MAVNKMNDGSGRWYASFYVKDHFGKQSRKKREGFRTKKEAKQFEEDYKKQYAGTCDMPFRAMCELYLRSAEPRLKESTLRKKRYLLESKILPTFGEIPVCDITALMVHDWQTALMRSGDLKPTYLRTICNDFISVFTYAMRYHGLKENPFSKTERIGKKDAGKMQFWTLSEYKKALDFADSTQARTIMEILFWTGMRRGECFALTPSDFDFAAGTVSITKTMHRYDRRDIITTPKTVNSRRVVTMPQHLCATVEAYLKQLYKPDPHARIFTLNPNSFDKIFHRIAAKADVRQIRVHDLRHSHASLLIEQGFTPLLIAERLGHESVDTTLRIYSHLYPNKQADVANRLDALAKS